ncbi:hypothetical protein LNQ81_12930 [Myroides sp. M-43]|uniref:hypothetical protein n=1 Tax=Myroides oncorhynchi TaxID=2893756 RepID=UPI001E429748|nr:hypothetical protein [Myroides oncorhynchi]MCC9043578.1 hypothetical protein [Myroides oncorhynchi]
MRLSLKMDIEDSTISYYENGQIRTKRDSLANGFTYYQDDKIRSKIEQEKACFEQIKTVIVAGLIFRLFLWL